ncbi:MAG: hypothetical protein ACK4PR_11675, partial [Gammaproteobacteria bacterium]
EELLDRLPIDQRNSVRNIIANNNLSSSLFHSPSHPVTLPPIDPFDLELHNTRMKHEKIFAPRAFD